MRTLLLKPVVAMKIANGMQRYVKMPKPPKEDEFDDGIFVGISKVTGGKIGTIPGSAMFTCRIKRYLLINEGQWLWELDDVRIFRPIKVKNYLLNEPIELDIEYPPDYKNPARQQRWEEENWIPFIKGVALYKSGWVIPPIPYR